MDVLVIGSGGREHAICHFLKKSPRLGKLYCAPGNAGIAQCAKPVGLAPDDIDGIVDFCKTNRIDYVVAAPEDPLAKGLVDALESAGIRAFGPRANAAIIEGSKVFSKNLMAKYNIPTAKFEVFSDEQSALEYIRKTGVPIVVKTDGLALGKGVTVAHDIKTAENAVIEIMRDRKFGDSGAKIVIEECMTGPEVTVLAFTDGKTIVPMLSSQDHKRAYDNDQGPNTGGMGAFCPSPNYTPEIEQLCMNNIFIPTINAMNAENRKFKGVIYFGLMLTDSGPKVVEYNARFGDPETQVVLSMLKTELLDIFEAVTDERLANIQIQWHNGAACCVVMASGGYPGQYTKGHIITGLTDLPDDVTVFHAGTAHKNGNFITNGGRVLSVTAKRKTLASSVISAYQAVNRISFENAHYRSDIGRFAVISNNSY